MIKFRAKALKDGKPTWIYSDEKIWPVYFRNTYEPDITKMNEYNFLQFFFEVVAYAKDEDCLLVPPQMWTATIDGEDIYVAISPSHKEKGE